MGCDHGTRPDRALSSGRAAGRRRRRGAAAAEAVLIAPLLLVCLWLIFFFGGAMIHKQKVIRTARAGTWAHVRVFTDRSHSHPPYDPDQIDPDPRLFYVWSGEPTDDRRVTTLYYMKPQTDPSAVPDESETAGGVGRLLVGFGNSPAGRAAQSYLSGPIPGGFQTETWSVTAAYDTQMVRWLGENINRTIESRYRMESGTWQNADYRAGLNLLPQTWAEDQMILQTVGGVQSLQVLPQAVPLLLLRLSVVR